MADGLLEIREAENHFTANPIVATILIDTPMHGGLIINEPPSGEPIGLFYIQNDGAAERFSDLATMPPQRVHFI